MIGKIELKFPSFNDAISVKVFENRCRDMRGFSSKNR